MALPQDSDDGLADQKNTQKQLADRNAGKGDTSRFKRACGDETSPY